jgi:NAD-dependent dihydropyrimidine dehydrogenase PreA subunit/flavodoxin
MILYYTGTGNSEYAALRIAKITGDETVNLFERIRDNDTSELQSDKPWVIVTPTYAWRVPRIVRRLLDKTELRGSRDIYFVMTCGSENGNAGYYAEKWCAGKNMNFKGCAGVQMPENYIAMFSAPSPKEEAEIIVRANGRIDLLAESIAAGESFARPKIGLLDKIYSAPVNAVFYPLFVKAKKFRATDECIGCGSCAAMCPTKNIRIENGRPVWGDDCTHCMACICRCPKQAVEYGSHTKGKRRYYCKEKLL